ncbi:glycosyltransferase family 2 protein [Methylovirgula sp. 4M-Z18]|uniref:glycosyltransferase family 2 protein n=1 Tax=Methylovirgula sp. 4M-Z18 TaxID=2293567 RepID=UPI0013147C7C|nr:glycosyltransferase [Methylovirgula sp. 4M-Z18]
MIIAAYNSAGTIARAIESALAEPETAELVVVDDGSSDDTIGQAQRADDGSGRMKILAQPVNRGPSVARNRALQNSTAPWIAILDADDFFLPGRLKSLLHYADKADFIADNLLQVDEQARDGEGSPLLHTIEPPRFVDFQQFVLANISGGKRERAEYGILKPLIRRSFLMDHALAYRENMRLGEDYELYARALALGGAFLLVSDQQKYVSVIRTASLSGRHTEHDLEQLRDCDDALAEIPGLSARDKAILRKHQLSIQCRLQWRLFLQAAKVRDLKGMVLPFIHPFPVPMYLAGLAGKQILREPWRLFKHVVLGRPTPQRAAAKAR